MVLLDAVHLQVLGHSRIQDDEIADHRHDDRSSDRVRISYCPKTIPSWPRPKPLPRLHFPFAFSPSSLFEPANPMPKCVARLRTPAALRLSRTAIAAEFSPDAARARSRSSSLGVHVE